MCSICRRDWRDAKPFVEGPGEFLMCRRCVADMREKCRESIGDSDPVLSRAEILTPLTPAEAANPYASPKVSGSVSVCRLCGQTTDTELWMLESGDAPFCMNCILEASAFIDSALALGW